MSILTTLDSIELILGSVIERHQGASFHRNRVASDLGDAKELLIELRKLLQQEKPRKPRVTREEIELCFRTPDYKTISDLTDIRNRVVTLFRSKDFEVVVKQ